MDYETTVNNGSALNAVEARILASVRKLKYGEVKITVHDAHVVQVETTDKVRFKLGKELTE